jgi:hypothetical protein
MRLYRANFKPTAPPAQIFAGQPHLNSQQAEQFGVNPDQLGGGIACSNRWGSTTKSYWAGWDQPPRLGFFDESDGSCRHARVAP